MKTVLFSIFLLVGADVFANQPIMGADKKKTWGEQPKDSLLKPLLNKYVVNEVIDLKTIDGHHFNLKANNNCDLKTPLSAEASFIQCQFDEAGMKKINLYICDEKETFCKFEKINVLVTAPKGYKKAAKKRVSSNIIFVPKSPKKAPPGFIKNRDKYAIGEAKKKDQPLLIVFAAQWCPACNMLDENVFVEGEFQKLSKNIVKLVVDVDSDVSWDLKEKFKIGAYPTTVLTTSTLNEVGRFIGYRSPSAVNAWLKEQLKNKKNPIELVVSKFQNNAATEEETLRLAQWQLDRNEPEAAKVTLLKLKSPAAQKLLHIADYQIYESEGKDEDFSKALVALMTQNPKDILVSKWASSLAQKNSKEAKKLKEIVEKNIEGWVANKEIENTAFTRAELFYNFGEYYNNIEETTLARQSFSKCADDYKKLSKASNLKIPRGAQMEQAFCLVKAGHTKEALEIFKGLVDVYKTEFAFNYYYARALFDTKSLDDAFKYATSALNGSYGDNMIRAAILKAQIEIEQKKLNEAEKTVTKTLEKIYLPSTTQIRSHRYVSNLKNVLAKIQLQKEAIELQKEESEKE